MPDLALDLAQSYVADPQTATNTADIVVLQGRLDNRDQKESVRLVSLTNLPLSGLAAIDGVTPVPGDRIGALGQTLGQAVGIYVAAAGAWARSPDADTSTKVTAGMFFFVTEGTAYADKAFELTTNDPIVLGTTPLVFAPFGGGGAASAISNDSGVSGATAKDALDTLNSTKANKAFTVRTVTGTSDTTLAADSGNVVHCTNAGAVAIGVPSGLPLGAYIYLFGGGAATQGTFTGSGGLTVTPPPGFLAKSRVGASGACVTLLVVSSTLAYLTGDASFT